MEQIDIKDTVNIIKRIQDGQIGVMPTDTIYGLVCDAFNKDAVEKVYEIKERNREKPFIFLISNIADLEKFSIEINDVMKDKISDYWPGPVSIGFSCNPDLTWLHRGTNKVVLRFPKNVDLINIISKTGPIVATSVNLEGEPAATSIDEVKKYFNNEKRIDFYIDNGTIESKASKIIEIDTEGNIKIIRE